MAEAADGQSGVEKAKLERPDLILMDIQLPIMDGYEATRLIKTDPSLKSTPVIAVSSFAMKGDEEKIKEGGCEAYISKPISVLSFLQTIDGFLKQAS